MENNNFNQEKINNIKNLVDNGNISDAISQISPEMIENFSKMFSSGDKSNSNTNTNLNFNSNSSNTSNNSSNSNSNYEQSNSSKSDNTYSNSNANNNGFDFSKLDINTIMKMKSVMEQMNNKNDPRSNLLYSLKPYLRETKQEKLDQYVNLLNVSKVAELLKNDKKKN